MDLCVRYTIHILKEGYKKNQNGQNVHSSSSVLIKGPHVILVDTGLPCETSILQKGLADQGVSPEQVEYVVCTHAHPENIGNLSLFPKATHIVGYDIMKGDAVLEHDFKNGIEYEIDDDVEVVATPGYSDSAVSVLVKNSNLGSVAISGSAFHSSDDLDDPDLWEEGSKDPETQQSSRIEVLQWAQWIIPRYGPPFLVPDSFRTEMKVVMTP